MIQKLSRLSRQSFIKGYRPLRGLDRINWERVPGVRSRSPRALCHGPLRGLVTFTPT